MNTMTIGKLAKEAEISTDAIRFYERRGLIAEPARTLSNYRVYPVEDATRLRFIKRAKDLGFSLSEIKELLAIRHDPSASKSEVKERTESKIRDIRQKIVDLSRILGALAHLVNACDGHGPVSDCPIIEALDEPHGEEHHHQNHGGTI